MAMLSFENLSFHEMEKGKRVRVRLLELFYFDFLEEDLRSLGNPIFKKKSIEFPKSIEKRASGQFYNLLSKHLTELTNSLTKRPAIYVHKNSGIPLIGTLFLGILDRNTTALEVKPITGCNMNCIFCSVAEGLDSKKNYDFVVEEEYLIQELKKVIDYKKKGGMRSKIDMYVNPHAEPLLYGDLEKLIHDMKKIKGVRKIILITNGTLLTEKKIDALAEAGLDELNISLNAFDQETAEKLEGTKAYNLEAVKKAIEYASTKMKVTLAPVWLNGYNDDSIEKIVEYGKAMNCEVCIQKFIAHKKGRIPKKAKEADWDEFTEWLKRLEKKYDTRLVMESHAHGAENIPPLPQPFKRDDIVKASIVAPGRTDHERIAAAQDRAITIYKCELSVGKLVNVKIIKSKDNVFVGEVVK